MKMRVLHEVKMGTLYLALALFGLLVPSFGWIAFVVAAFFLGSEYGRRTSLRESQAFTARWRARLPKGVWPIVSRRCFPTCRGIRPSTATSRSTRDDATEGSETHDGARMGQGREAGGRTRRMARHEAARARLARRSERAQDLGRALHGRRRGERPAIQARAPLRDRQVSGPHARGGPRGLPGGPPQARPAGRAGEGPRGGGEAQARRDGRRGGGVLAQGPGQRTCLRPRPREAAGMEGRRHWRDLP